MSQETYRCCECGGTFNKAWTDEEALQECKVEFGTTDMKQLVQLCDDCYQKFMEWHKQKAGTN